LICLREQELTKNGEIDDGATLPEKPALHVQPEGTLEPALLAGHATAGCEMLGKKDKPAQVETKNGDEEEAVTAPENPGLHVQPAGTLDPTLLAGQDTAGVSSRCREKS